MDAAVVVIELGVRLEALSPPRDEVSSEHPVQRERAGRGVVAPSQDGSAVSSNVWDVLPIQLGNLITRLGDQVAGLASRSLEAIWGSVSTMRSACVRIR
jgi:hypothetical protein